MPFPKKTVDRFRRTPTVSPGSPHRCEAAATRLSAKPDRDELFRDIASFRAELAAQLSRLKAPGKSGGATSPGGRADMKESGHATPNTRHLQ